MKTLKVIKLITDVVLILVIIFTGVQLYEYFAIKNINDRHEEFLKSPQFHKMMELKEILKDYKSGDDETYIKKLVKEIIVDHGYEPFQLAGYLCDYAPNYKKTAISWVTPYRQYSQYEEYRNAK
jgi:hypothetical protein